MKALFYVLILLSVSACANQPIEETPRARKRALCEMFFPTKECRLGTDKTAMIRSINW